MEKQDINSQFSSFFDNYNKTTPNERLSEIASRRNIELGNLNAATLRNPDSSPDALRVWKKARFDLNSLIEPMSSTIWKLAYKYFPEALSDVRHMNNEQEKKDAIKAYLFLSENNIDAENELKDQLKAKICETEYTINGEQYPLVEADFAETKTPKELVDELDKRIKDMHNVFDEDDKDLNTLSEVRGHIHTYKEFLKALAKFFNQDSGATMKTTNANGTETTELKYDYVDQPSPRLICRTVTKSIPVLTVSPIIRNDAAPGKIDSLLFSIKVEGIGLPDNSSIIDSGSQTELGYYIRRHRAYSPNDDGGYTVSGVRGTNVPSIVYNAVRDWYKTATACEILDKSYTSVEELLGPDSMNDFRRAESANSWERDMANSKGALSTSYPEIHQRRVKKFEDRANVSRPKMNNGVYTKDDISNMLSKIKAKLDGNPDADSILSDQALARILHLDDGERKV